MIDPTAIQVEFPYRGPTQGLRQTFLALPGNPDRLDVTASLRRLLLAGLAALALAGCASLPPPVERTPSQALAAVDQTSLGRLVATQQPSAAVSGFQLIPSGDDAYEARLTLADRAEKTLDLQYYIIRADPPTRALFRRIRKAAERGVRVRLLIDDLDTAGRDAAFAYFSALPNIQVRVFNPFAAGRSALLSRVFSSLQDLRRLNRRMHNKLFIADNALGIAGGRNLGAEYFRRNGEVNFIDLDVLAAGPAVRDLSKTFDIYWNNELAYPIEAFAKAPATPPAPPADQVQPAPSDAPVASGKSLQSRLAAGDLKLAWAPAKVLVDRPGKVTEPGEADDDTVIYDDIVEVIRRAKKEVLMISPYFVPGNLMMDLLRELRGRGVVVRVLTNSLATTDVPAVHAGYSRYRAELLKLGVVLYELRPIAGAPPASSGFGSSRASLHSKAIVVDQRLVFVGSMNIDPRSAKANTEVGLVINSAVLGKQMANIFEEGVRPDSSYRLQLSPENQAIEWMTGESGEQRLFGEPGAGFPRNLMNSILRLTAPEDLL